MADAPGRRSTSKAFRTSCTPGWRTTTPGSARRRFARSTSETRVVREVAFVAGFESGVGPVSAGDGVFAYEFHGEGLSAFAFRDGEGNFIDVAGDPFQGRVCVSRTIDGGPCYRHIELDGEHGRMAYVEVSREAGPTASELVVVEIDGTPVARVPCRSPPSSAASTCEATS